MENNEVIVKEKSNKGLIIIIVILTIIVLGLAGYLVYDKFIAKTPTPQTTDNTNSNAVDNTTTNDTKKVLKKDESKDVVYTEISAGKHRVPQINIDSETATKFNQEIMSFYDGFKKGEGLAASYTEYDFGYKYYINDEIVSIVVSHTTESGAENPTKVYNINQYTGKEVTKTELLAKANIDESQFSSKLIASYKKIDSWDKIMEEINTMPTNMRDAELNFKKGVYDGNINKLSQNDFIGLYLNNNQIYVIFDMNTYAGAGHQQTILNMSNNTIQNVGSVIIN